MTSEDDFQAALDADPDDWQTRLVFADWLEERGDPRAEGYRALGAVQFRPLRIADRKKIAWTVGTANNPDHRDHPRHGRAMVPADWYELVRPPTPAVHGWKMGAYWAYFRTRRECEDTLARDFAKLPLKRRAELLAETPYIPKPKPAKTKPTRRKQPK